MFDTELSRGSLTVDYLWIVCISLSLNLLHVVFLENLRDILSLMHLDHVSIDGWTSIVWLVSLEGILLSWGHDCFFRM